MATSLAVAMLLNAKVKGMAFYRTFFYLPSIVPVVASAVLWAWVLNGDPNRGLLNAGWKATIGVWFHVAAAGLVRRGGVGQAGADPAGPVGRGRRHDPLAGRPAGRSPSQLYEAADLDGAARGASSATSRCRCSRPTSSST